MPALKGHVKAGGRAKGTPNKVTAQIKTMIENALMKAGGEDYLARQAEENPPAFMALVGRALPLQVSGDPAAPLTIITKAL
jgi:hypothetical protein